MPSFTKSSVSHLKDDDLAPGKVRRLASASSFARILGRRLPSSKENIPTTQPHQQVVPAMRPSKPTEPLADMPPPSLNQRRPRRVSSPHPNKEILARSVTLSNLPVPKHQLPSTNSSVSLLGRAPAPSASPSGSTRKTIAAKPAGKDGRQSLIPTPTNRKSFQGSNASPRTKPRGNEVRVRPATVTPVEVKPPEAYTATPQKLRHKQSKSPERKAANVIASWYSQRSALLRS